MQSVERDGAGEVVLKSGVRLQADMVILALGIRPSTRLAADAGLELTQCRAQCDALWKAGELAL